MIRLWLSEEQAKSVLVLISKHLNNIKDLSGNSAKGVMMKWQQIYDMIGTQIEEQKQTDDI